MAGKEAPAPIIVSGPLGFITKSLGIQPWGQVLILALIGCGVFLYNRLGDINDHLAKNELQIQLMPLELSKQLLAQAETDLKFGRLEKVLRITDAATAVITKAADRKTQAPAAYFSETLSTINGMASNPRANNELATSLQAARLMLAEYRSAIEKPPYEPPNKKSLDVPVPSSNGQTLEYGRTTLDFHMVPGKDMIDMQGNRFLSREILVNGPVLKANGSSQTLDGIRWHNVIFVGAHIKYLGGELDLQNVRFVDCTFEIENSPHGQQLIEYAALAENKLAIS